MKTKNLVLAVAVTAFTLGFASCKKTDKTEDNSVAGEVEFSSDQAVSDNLTEDANDVFMEAAADQRLTGGRVQNVNRPEDVTGNMNLLGCATVTVTPLVGFPKTILIDFGTGCSGQNGVTRSGSMTIVLSDSVRKPGSTAVTTFNNFYVSGFKKEGTITWTNTSTATQKSWQRKVENGKITAPGGRYWLHNGIRNVAQIAGYATPFNTLDDVFSITGNHSVTKMNGVTRNFTTLEPLIKKTVCENITKGKVQMVGPNHTAVIDYGNGDCDRIATISIDGGAPTTFLLR